MCSPTDPVSLRSPAEMIKKGTPTQKTPSKWSVIALIQHIKIFQLQPVWEKSDGTKITSPGVVIKTFTEKDGGDSDQKLLRLKLTD